MATEKPRFSITVSEETLNEIVSYQEANHFATRSGAIQHLINIGIEEILKMSGNTETQKSPALSNEALRLAVDYDHLDEHGRHVVSIVSNAELERMYGIKTKPAPVELSIVARGGKTVSPNHEPNPDEIEKAIKNTPSET